MPVRTYTTATNLTRCMYDHHVEIVDNCARLKARMLLADDIGAVTSRTYELLQGNIWASKSFMVGFTDARDAELVLRAEPYSPDGRADDGDYSLVIEINGQTIVHEYQEENTSFQGTIDRYWSTGWEIIPIPCKAFKAGLNKIRIYAGDGQGWRLFVDTMRCQGRSAKSIDGGKTWTTERLGLNDFCTGEYVARLNLHRHAPSGMITSIPVDMAAVAGDGAIAPRLMVKSVCFSLNAERPRGTGITLQWRSGSTPSYHPDAWGHWCDASGPVSVSKSHRFVQWQATLTTARGDATPLLKGVDIEISGTLTKQANKSLQITDISNDELIRASYPFAYQLTDEPRLKILREKYRLDHVVKGATTEFEKFLRLKRWIRQQWEDGWSRGELHFVPPWDGLVVLDLASRKQSLGMCTHYASTFVQCCLSLGLQARVCITTAHCVAEIWSNEHRKWVMMDPGCDADDGRKATRYFERKGVPMSALDLHLASAENNFEGVREICDPERMDGTDVENASRYYQFCTTVRNNFLTSLYPEEPEHGAVSYTYNGHIWYESNTMPLSQFSIASRRPGDFNWSVNQTHISLQQGSEPNSVTVLLDTATPNFDTYLIKINNRKWRDSKERFVWKLNAGNNTLRVKSLNQFGVEGIESSVVIERKK